MALPSGVEECARGERPPMTKALHEPESDNAAAGSDCVNQEDGPHDGKYLEVDERIMGTSIEGKSGTIFRYSASCGLGTIK